MSLDGYIAGPNGESDWILMDPEIDFAAMMDSFDAIVMGRKTYDATKQYSGGGMPGTKSYVVSRTLRQEDCPGVVVTDDPAATITAIKAETGKDIWLFGGGMLFRSLLALGLVDSIEVAVIPVLLGGGLPLFPPPSDRQRLKLVKHRVYQKTGTIALEYVPV